MNRRTKYWINKEVQSGYIKFLVLFWFVCLAVSVMAFACILILQLKNTNANQIALEIIQFYQVNPFLIFVFTTIHFLVSFVFGLYFFRSFSHRICGPIYNIENHFKKLNQNTDPEFQMKEFKIRKNDYFQSFVNELNTFFKSKKLFDIHKDEK